MSRLALLSGPDPDGLADALESEGLEVRWIDGAVTAAALADAGIDDAELLVLTDAAEATGVSLAKRANPELRVVFYCRQSLPAFATRQTDLAVDPGLLGVDVVAEELAGA